MALTSKHVHIFMRPIVTCKFIFTRSVEFVISWICILMKHRSMSVLPKNYFQWTNIIYEIIYYLKVHFFWQILVCMKVISMMMMLPFQLLIENAIRSVITPKGTSTENLAYYDETRHKKSLFFLFKSKHQNLNGLDVYHLYAA